MFTLSCFVNMAVRHKHLKLDQDKLDRARRFLGVATEQETVDIALDLLVAEAIIVKAHDRIGGVGGFEDVFAGDPGSKRRRRR